MNYQEALQAAMDDATASIRAGRMVVPDQEETYHLREKDAADYVFEARQMLRVTDHKAEAAAKQAALVSVLTYLIASAMLWVRDYGPMSEGRAELVEARARLTIDGHHGAADAIHREMAGVL